MTGNDQRMPATWQELVRELLGTVVLASDHPDPIVQENIEDQIARTKAFMKAHEPRPAVLYGDASVTCPACGRVDTVRIRGEAMPEEIDHIGREIARAHDCARPFVGLLED